MPYQLISHAVYMSYNVDYEVKEKLIRYVKKNKNEIIATFADKESGLDFEYDKYLENIGSPQFDYEIDLVLMCDA